MNWTSFYEKRVNTSYQDYFEERYKDFLEFILMQKERIIIEMGCGIGSVSKYLKKHDICCLGFDLSMEMVELANKNLNSNAFYQDDIFTSKANKNRLKVTHGVLEHFEDDKILEICFLHPNSIHYVPLDKYETPSFGDERLLPVEHWLNLVQPKEYFIFNNNYDLCFKV